MNRKENKKDYITSVIIIILYIAGLIFIGCFHEPWFDEAQAWLIAKSASYKEIITVVPHYEGHPPLWHLLLSVFAKNGASFDIALKSINITFCTIAMSLIVFRSPFPKIVRYGLPFTYFFFYQYGVYCRPYSMIMAEFMLIAILYKERDSKPWRYILALALLCMSHAYGIMVAGGLCLAWTVEIIVELYNGGKLASFYKDKRFYSLCFILAVAVIIITMIFPAEDCFYPGVEDNKSFMEVFTDYGKYILLLIMPFESWSGVIIGLYGLKSIVPVVIVEIAIGLLSWVFLIMVTKKNKKLLTFFLPYIIMTGFMTFKYMSVHHIGLSAVFHVFIFWIMTEQEGGIRVPEFLVKIKDSFSSPLIRNVIYGAGVLICLMPVVYSIGASYMDINGECGTSEFGRVIKANHLEDKKIMAEWHIDYETVSADGIVDMNAFKVLEIPSEHEKIKGNKTFLMFDPVMILPYFDRNIFMNFNADCSDDLYMHYKYEDTEETFEKWRKKGLPDFIISYCPIDEIYDEKILDGVKYLAVHLVECNIFYKLDSNTYFERMYMREDLFEDYPQFKWIDDQRGNVYERK